MRTQDDNDKIQNSSVMSKGTKCFIFILITGVILVGGLVPFFAQFVGPFFFPRCRIAGAEVWNQYVSIILGIVATITSIISLILSLRSEEQAHETERRTRDLIQELGESVKEVYYRQEEMNHLLNNGLSKFSEKSENVSKSLKNGKVVKDDELMG